MELGARLLGTDDHARDQGRPRGLHAGVRRGRRGGRRDRDPHQGHRGHVAGDLVGQRPGDGGPLQRRPVLRAGLPGLRDRVAGDPPGGHRPRGGALHQLRRRRDALHLHQRLHGRVRRQARRHRRSGPRGGARARRAARRRAAGQLDPEPDPDLRAARHRRPGHPHAAVPRPARHVAEHDAPGLAQRGRLRRVPGRRAAQVRARRPAAAAAQDRRPPRHRRRPRRRDADLPGQDPRRRRLPRRHARDAGRRRDRRPHRGRRRHGDAAGDRDQGPGDRRPGALPARRGPAVPGQAADGRRSVPARRRWPPAKASGRSRSRCRSASSAPARTSTPPPTTACAAPPSCSACPSRRS